ARLSVWHFTVQHPIRIAIEVRIKLDNARGDLSSIVCPVRDKMNVGEMQRILATFGKVHPRTLRGGIALCRNNLTFSNFPTKPKKAVIILRRKAKLHIQSTPARPAECAVNFTHSGRSPVGDTGLRKIVKPM